MPRPKNDDIPLDQAAILRRVAELAGVQQDIDVAAALGVTPQSYSTWKARGTIPFARICALAQARGVSLDWLLLGRGEPPAGGSRLDAELLGFILRRLWRGLDELGGPLNFSFLVSSAAWSYNTVSEVDHPEREQRAAVEVDRCLAALAYATASLARQRALLDQDGAHPDGEVEAVRLERIAAAFESRTRP